MRLKNTRFLMLALALALAMSANAIAQSNTTTAPQVQQPPDNGVDWSGVGIGAGTVAADVVYVPMKLVYALVGGITGAASWAVTGGNSQISDTIWRSSLGGDYVLTPEMVRGDAPIHFSGPTQTAEATAAPAAAPAASSAANATSAPATSSASTPPLSGSTAMSIVPASPPPSAGPGMDTGSGPVSGSASTAPARGLGIE